jgi:hypothetical protein
MADQRTDEVNQIQPSNNLLQLKEDNSKHQELVDELLNTPVTLLKQIKEKKVGLMDLANKNKKTVAQRITEKRQQKINNKPPSLMDLAKPNNTSASNVPNESNACRTKSPHLISCNIQTAVDEYTQEELENISVEELAIKVRLRDIQFLMKEFSGSKEQFEHSKTISLDQYREYIKNFQENHFPAICNENKSVVTGDQNPFPEHGLNYEKVTKKQLDSILDKLDVLVEQETNALTYLSIKLKEVTENHFRVSFINMQNVGKKTEDEVMVQNQRTQ